MVRCSIRLRSRRLWASLFSRLKSEAAPQSTQERPGTNLAWSAVGAQREPLGLQCTYPFTYWGKSHHEGISRNDSGLLLGSLVHIFVQAKLASSRRLPVPFRMRRHSGADRMYGIESTGYSGFFTSNIHRWTHTFSLTYTHTLSLSTFSKNDRIHLMLLHLLAQ